MRTILIKLLAAMIISTAGCSIYKVDIRQGNELEEEQIAKLKVGMDRQQVKFIMGNPLLTDPFHENRWDYVHTLKQGGKTTTRRVLTLIFDGDKLVEIDKSQLKETVLK